MKGKVVVLCSGGVDSVALAYHARELCRLAGLVFVDYGQPAAAQEERAAVQCAVRTGVELALVSCRLPVASLDAGVGAPGPRVVPGRNMVLLALAASRAVELGEGVNEVWIGCTAEDQESYDDCRPAFIKAACAALLCSCGVWVRAPFIEKSRKQVRAIGERFATLDYCWSCYQPGADGLPCGRCNSCRQG